MKVRLINSRMMPKSGTYEMKDISTIEFYDRIKDAHDSGVLIHNIGYAQNIEIINKNTGLSLATNREQTELEDGDELLMMALKYRANTAKGARVKSSDFHYSIATYSKPRQKELTPEQKRFLDNMKSGETVTYSFPDDVTTIDGEPENWKDDIRQLKKYAKESLGVGYQKKIAEKTGMKPQTISRVFQMRFSPTYKVLFEISKAIGHKVKFVNINRS